MSRRFQFFLVHLACSATLLIVVGAAILLMWFPVPFRTSAGGLGLLAIMGSVDMILGPLMTLLLVSPAKGRREIAFDLTFVALVQLAALGYGLHSVYVARPVHTVFEIDRFVGISANDVLSADLPAAAPALLSLPLTGPTLIAAQKGADRSRAGVMGAVDLALAGFDISSQPKRWVPYASMLPDVLKASRPVAQLIGAYPALQPQLAALADSEKLPLDQLRFLPMVIHKAQWTAVLSPDASRILDYYHVDGFIDQKQAAPVKADMP